MVPSADDKKYAADTRLFKDAVIQDGIFKNFEASPLIDQVPIKDICIYGAGTPKPGVVNPDPMNPADWLVQPDFNKLGKVSNRTSWDSFSYAIQMGHNVWSHLNAVQTANQAYDNGVMPAMMDTAYSHRKKDFFYDLRYFKDMVDAIFAATTRAEADRLVDYYKRYFDTIIGTRGNTGDKMTNSSSQFGLLFDVEDEVTSDDHGDEFTDEEIHKLDDLEDSIK
jgi:hypothetical protein